MDAYLYSQTSYDVVNAIESNSASIAALISVSRFTHGNCSSFSSLSHSVCAELGNCRRQTRHAQRADASPRLVKPKTRKTYYSCWYYASIATGWSVRIPGMFVWWVNAPLSMTFDPWVWSTGHACVSSP